MRRDNKAKGRPRNNEIVYKALLQRSKTLRFLETNVAKKDVVEERRGSFLPWHPCTRPELGIDVYREEQVLEDVGYVRVQECIPMNQGGLPVL